jgi:glycosyltransferase involved in cell wall biosynthesis
VARLVSQKNVDGLLRAFDRATEDADATLTVVGDGPERPSLQRTARRLGLADRVAFRGRLGREGVRAALWDAHAFVLPSHHETFGVVLLEAMATGLPVVATASGGPEDLVTSETGCLVPPGDPDALANALQRMITSWSSYDADALRQHTLDRYGPEPFVRRTRLLYGRALAQTP